MSKFRFYPAYARLFEDIKVKLSDAEMTDADNLIRAFEMILEYLNLKFMGLKFDLYSLDLGLGVRSFARNKNGDLILLLAVDEMMYKGSKFPGNIHDKFEFVAFPPNYVVEIALYSKSEHGILCPLFVEDQYMPLKDFATTYWSRFYEGLFTKVQWEMYAENSNDEAPEAKKRKLLKASFSSCRIPAMHVCHLS